MVIELIIILIVIISVVFFRISHLKTKKMKDDKIKDDKIIVDKKKSLLKEKKIKEDFELSLQKEVKCDDGVDRIYNGFMYGVLKVQIKTINVDKIIVSHEDIIQMSKSSGVNHIKNVFNKNIRTESWFSESGISLDLEQILIKRDFVINMRNSYKTRYRSIMATIKWNHRIKEIEDILIINNYVFLETPFTPFYGEIDGVNYINGKKEISDLNENDQLKNKSENFGLRKILELNPAMEHKIIYSFTEEWKQCYFQDKNKSHENLKINSLPVLDDKYDQDTGESLYNEKDEKVFDPNQEIKYEYYLPITQTKIFKSNSFVKLFQIKINELIKLNELSKDSDVYELFDAMNLYQNPETIEEIFDLINCNDWIDLKTGKNEYESLLWFTSSQLDETNVELLIEEIN